jgi:23S rRNA pseudouridine2604 synthase
MLQFQYQNARRSGPSLGVPADAPAAAPRHRAPSSARPPASPARHPRNAGATGTIRLNKRMAELGMCSRREADDWIAKGWVKVNGQVATMGMQVGPDATASRSTRRPRASRPRRSPS